MLQKVIFLTSYKHYIIIYCVWTYVQNLKLVFESICIPVSIDVIPEYYCNFWVVVNQKFGNHCKIVWLKQQVIINRRMICKWISHALCSGSVIISLMKLHTQCSKFWYAQCFTDKSHLLKYCDILRLMQHCNYLFEVQGTSNRDYQTRYIQKCN